MNLAKCVIPLCPPSKGEKDFCFPPFAFAFAEASAKAHSEGTEEGLREVTVFLFLSSPSVPLRRGIKGDDSHQYQTPSEESKIFVTSPNEKTHVPVFLHHPVPTT